LRRAGSDRSTATIITQVLVSRDDPALEAPTKFVGHEINAERAEELVAEGNVVRTDGRGRLRRVVASPTPIGVNEVGVIRALTERGTIVVACGGGGAPVYRHSVLGLEGIDAVIDKDLAAAVLARDLGAELLIILTDVDAVYLDWGKPTQRALSSLTIDEAEALDREGSFGEGSMGPKVRASIEFVRRTGGRAIITELKRGRDAVRGEAGTTITAERT
jgi:carbamate kinase